MTPDQEEAILVKCIEVLSGLTGKKPRGYIAPWWELSNATAGLLLKHGFVYDHSMFHDDYTPYYVRVGDTWTVIDYSQHPVHVDEAARARHRDEADRNSGKLVSRRSAADDVHQEGAEQPRLRQSARHRRPVARPVRLGLSRDGLRGVSDRDPPGRLRDVRRCC